MAASMPAWPAPTTTTSKRKRHHFPMQNRSKIAGQHVVAVSAAQPARRTARARVQFGSTNSSGARPLAAARPHQPPDALEQLDVSHVGDRRRVAAGPRPQRAPDRVPQLVQAVAGRADTQTQRRRRPGRSVREYRTCSTPRRHASPVSSSRRLVGVVSGSLASSTTTTAPPLPERARFARRPRCSTARSARACRPCPPASRAGRPRRRARSPGRGWFLVPR